MESFSKIINYTTRQLWIIKEYRIVKKCTSANYRFKADIISTHDVLTVLEKHNLRCMYCDQNLKPKDWQLDHFHPKANGGKNLYENLAPSCKWCNQMKGALDGYSFLNKCQIICENNFFKKTLDMNVYMIKPSSEKRLKKINNRNAKLDEFNPK